MQNVLGSYKFKLGLLVVLIAGILTFLGFSASAFEGNSRAIGPNPYAKVKITKVYDGTGFENKESSTFVNKENGFNPGDNGPDDGVVSSHDYVGYDVEVNVEPGDARKISVTYKIPEYLEFNKDLNKDVCQNSRNIKGKVNTSKLAQGEFSCDYEVEEGSNITFVNKLILSAKDTKGKVSDKQEVEVGIGTTGKEVYQSYKAKPVVVVSAPATDLVIKPIKCTTNQQTKCSDTYNVNKSGDAKKGFDIIVEGLSYKGYDKVKGITKATKWSADLDISAFKDLKDITWWVDGKVVVPKDNKIALNDIVGSIKVEYQVKDAQWGLAERESKIYDINLIPSKDAFSTESFKNNGTGWMPGAGEDKTYKTENDKDSGASKGYIAQNSKWTSVTVQNIPEYKPGVVYSFTKGLRRTYDGKYTIWENENKVFKDNNNSTVCYDYGCQNNAKITQGVSGDTEVLDVLSLEGKFKDDDSKKEVVIGDSWDNSQYSVRGDLKDFKMPKKTSYYIEWSKDKKQNDDLIKINDKNGWIRQEKPIEGAQSVRVVFSNISLTEIDSDYHGFNLSYALPLQVKDNLLSDEELLNLAGFAAPDYNKFVVSYAHNLYYRIPKEPSLDLNIRPSTDKLSNSEERKSSWTFEPTINKEINRDSEKVSFEIELDACIIEASLKENSNYKIDSIQLGSGCGSDNPIKGKIVISMPSDWDMVNWKDGKSVLPKFILDTKTSMLADNQVSISTSMKTDNIKSVKASSSVLVEPEIEIFSKIKALTPRVEVNDELKYQIDINGMKGQSGYNKTIVALPGRGDDTQYARDITSNYKGPKESNINGSYSVDIDIVKNNNTPGTRVLCSTKITSDVNDASFNENNCNSNDVKLLNIQIPADESVVLANVVVTLKAKDNIRDDNYLMWLLPTIYNGVKTDMPYPANEEVVASDISGHVYFNNVEKAKPYVDGDKGYSNVMLGLFDKDGKQIATTKTNTDGYYEFLNYHSGEYTVKIISGLPSVGTNFYANNPEKFQVYSYLNKTYSNSKPEANVDLKVGDVISVVDFGYSDIKIEGHVYYDMSGDAKTFDENRDKGFANVSLGLYDENGSLIETTKTKADGLYSFENLPGVNKYKVQILNGVPKTWATKFNGEKELYLLYSYPGAVFEYAKDSAQIFASGSSMDKVDFGYFADDPHFNLDKSVSKVVCDEDDVNIPCDVSWDISIENDGNIELNNGSFVDTTSKSVYDLGFATAGNVKKIIANDDAVGYPANNSFALMDDGSVYSWGYNDHYILGHGINYNEGYKAQVKPRKIKALEGINITNIFRSDYSHIIVEADDGSKYVWGYQHENGGGYTDGPTFIEGTKGSAKIKDFVVYGSSIFTSYKVYIDEAGELNFISIDYNNYSEYPNPNIQKSRAYLNNTFLKLQGFDCNVAGVAHLCDEYVDKNISKTALIADFQGYFGEVSLLDTGRIVVNMGQGYYIPQLFGVDEQIKDITSIEYANPWNYGNDQLGVLLLSDAGNVYFLYDDGQHGIHCDKLKLKDNIKDIQAVYQYNDLNVQQDKLTLSFNVVTEDNDYKKITYLRDDTLAEEVLEFEVKPEDQQIYFVEGSDFKFKSIYFGGSYHVYVLGVDNKLYTNDEKMMTKKTINKQELTLVKGLEGKEIKEMDNIDWGYYAVDIEGNLYVWMQGTNLGTAKFEMKKIAIPEGRSIKQISMSYGTGYVLLDNGSLFVLGSNVNHTLGLPKNKNGQYYDALQPVNTVGTFRGYQSDEQAVGDFVRRTYDLNNIEKGTTLEITLAGKVNRNKLDQVIGNQAYASFEELPINEKDITLNKLPEYGNPSDPYEAGKWSGNTTCAIKNEGNFITRMFKSYQNIDECDQVYAKIPGVPEIKLSSLSGKVFEDTKKAGKYETGMPVLEGIKVELRQGNGTLFGTTTTDKDGKYEFKDLLLADDYYVVFNPGEKGIVYTKTTESCPTLDESCAKANGSTIKVKVGENPTTEVNAGIIAGIEPDLSVDKGYDSNKSEYDSTYILEKVGEEFVVKTKVSNTGNEPVNNVVLSDTTKNGSKVIWQSCSVGVNDIKFELDIQDNVDKLVLDKDFVLGVDESVICQGTLKGEIELHKDSMIVSGNGYLTEKEVEKGPSDFETELGRGLDEPITPSIKEIGCGKEKEVTIPDDTDKVKYESYRQGDFIIVEAIAQDGYFFDTKVTTEWKFDVKAVDCVTTPTKPNIVDPNKPGIPDVPEVTIDGGIITQEPSYKVECDGVLDIKVPENSDEVKYSKIIDGKYIIVKAEAQEGYYFEDGVVSEWKFELKAGAVCTIPEVPGITNPEKPGVDIPTDENEGIIAVKPDFNVDCEAKFELVMPKDTDEVAYTKVKINDYEYKVIASAKDGYDFKEDTTTEWVVKLPKSEDCAIVVEPTLNKTVNCDEDYKVVANESDSVKYEITYNGKIATIKAIAKDGYKFKDSDTTEWILDTSNEVKCAIVVEPTLDKNVDCEQDYKIVADDTDSIRYEITYKDKIATIKAIAKDGYEFKPGVNTEWTFDITNTEKCPIPIKPTKPGIINPGKPGTEVPIVEKEGIISPAPDYKLECDGKLEVKLPELEGVEYTQKVEDKYIIVSASAKEGYVLEGVSEWKFELITSDKCAIPEIPNIIDPSKPGTIVPSEKDKDIISPKPEYDVDCGVGLKIELPKTKGIDYTQVEEDGFIVVSAKAQEGYELKGESQWKFKLPEVVACIKDINDIVAPVLDTEVECNKIPTINTSEVEGIVWDVKHNEKDFSYTIKAKAKDGYKIKDGITTEWTLDYTIEVCNVDKPGVIDPGKPGTEIPTTEDKGVIVVAPEVSITCDKQAEIKLPEVIGLTYTKEVLENGNVKVVAKANKGYKLAKGAISEWQFKLPEVEKCIIDVVPTRPNIIDPEKPGTVVPGIENNDIISPDPSYKIDCGKGLAIDLPKIEGLEYKQEVKDGYIIVKASAKEGYAIAKDSVSEWKFELPKVIECDIEITPEIPNIVDPSKPGTEVPTENNEGVVSVAPTYKVDCGVGLIIDLPVSAGLTYTKTIEDNYIVVKVSANKGYTIKEGSATSWKFEIPEVVECDIEVTPEIPNVIDPSKPGGKVPTDTDKDGVISIKPEYEVDCGIELSIDLPKVKGITYSKEIVDGYIIVKAVADKGYELKGESQWKFKLPKVEECDIKVTPEIPNVIDPSKPETEVPTETDNEGVISIKPDYKVDCGIELEVKLPETKGITYSKEVVDGYIIVKAVADKGYEIDGQTEWKFKLLEVEECEAIVTPKPKPEPEEPEVEQPNMNKEKPNLNKEKQPSLHLPQTGSEWIMLGSLATVLTGLVFVLYKRLRRD